MKHSKFWLCLAPWLLVLAGCQQQQSELEYTTVAVYPTTQRCGIDDKMMICGEVSAYLRDTLKLKAEHQVIVSAVGTDPLPKDDQSLDMIAAKIREAGFKDVRTANFDVK